MVKEYPRITLVTPNFNGAKFLEQTILSVLNQNYPNLEYIIVDGGSSDRSIEIIKTYESRLSSWASEKDNGLYDALNKGFKNASGSIMGWINSDDMLHQNSLFTVAEIFSSQSDIEWIQGYPTLFDSMGRIVDHRPPIGNKYKFYSGDYKDGNFIQQESTFWKKSLWEKAGSYISTNYKLAGDFELWMRFFRHADLYNTHALIGGFRISENQLSRNNFEEYLNEADEIIKSDYHTLDKEIKSDLNFIKKFRNNNRNSFMRILKKASSDKYTTLLKEKSLRFDFKKNRFQKNQ